MQLEQNRVGNVLVAKVRNPRITADTARQFRAELLGAIGRGNRSVVIDLAAATLIDSSGLGVLLGACRAMGENGELAISGARPAAAGIFRLTRTDHMFRMYGTTTDAVAALSRSSPSGAGCPASQTTVDGACQNS